LAGFSASGWTEHVRLFAAILGLALIALTLWDVFETIILPRRVTRQFRLARMFYRSTWRPWSAVARKIPGRNYRESFLSFYGPLSLLGLFAFWAVGLMFAFACLHYGNGSAIVVSDSTAAPNFWTDLYMSGSTFFTLGLGDVTPRTPMARLITVAEAGIGFGFLAVVIGYLPVLYGAFSRREVNISLLDARAGSPPTAAEFLRRHVIGGGIESLTNYLQEWENWSAELMESHLSYPVLCYFRSLHNNQSWLASLTTVLDVTALLLAYGDGSLRWQANLTFAISRHAIVDLAQVLNAPPSKGFQNRLSIEDAQQLRALLSGAGLAPRDHDDDQRLTELRHMYEPHVIALGRRLQMAVPAWNTSTHTVDNWRTSQWSRDMTSVEPGKFVRSQAEEHD
jgi:hypothetical protein